MRTKAVRLGGAELAFVQEDWESAVTVFLPQGIAQGQNIELEFEPSNFILIQQLLIS
jgi:hypothetical protein